VQAASRLARALPVAWIALGAMTTAEAVHDILGLGRPDALFTDAIHDAVLVGAAILCLASGAYRAADRTASLALGIGLASWAAADLTWTALYAGNPHPPYPTVADALWLAWYPCMAAGFALLIRRQIPHFELHRWMDGLAVMLIVLTPCAGLLLQPALEESVDSTLANVVNFAYPFLDTLLIGAVLGVYGLMAWRPGRAWLLLGLGCVLMAVSDALFSVQEARHSYIQGSAFDFAWSAGAVLIAYAAWQAVDIPEAQSEVVGWRAIVLPVAAQLLAAGIQAYGLFHPLGDSERIITLTVLLIATIQIIVSRPRAQTAGS
jgi:hypothetical protein